MENWQRGGFGLYLHWPFCESKCPYCDFNSHVVQEIDRKRWQSAYLREIDRAAELTKGRVLSSVFFGGGTPSLMEPALVASILAQISDKWTLSNSVEITLEANPGSVEASRFQGYREAGVNRISLGLQALNDGDLKLLGRMHSAREGLEALDIARATFSRVSFDLIYARQNQTLENWQKELQQALSFQPDHLSLYQLTIEDGTVFGARHRKGQLRGLPNDDLSVELFELTQSMASDAGLPAYEISNHARPGEASRHNLIYWRMGDYLGIGPGAHGRLSFGSKRLATEEMHAPTQWLSAIENAGSARTKEAELSETDIFEEYTMMALRLSEGAEKSVLGNFDAAIWDQASKNDLVKAGHLIETEDAYKVPVSSRLVLNRIISELLV